MATRRLARWTINLTPESIPSNVIDATLSSFYNYVGCALAGSTHPASQHALKALKPLFGSSASSVLTSSRSSGTLQADPLSAALINGIASHVHDYDDTHLSTIIHPTGPVASALTAYAEYSSQTLKKPISGRDFLFALAAGIETECKLGLSVWPSHYDVGWHITCTVGCIGAAIAVGKLMNLAETQLVHAIGLASCQVIGHREHFGSETKSFGVGRAAQSGLQAAFLAQAGMTSSEFALEGKRGWVATVCPEAEASGRSELEKRMTELETQSSSDWETVKNAFKPYPCGIVIHPAIDGCSQLHREHFSHSVTNSTSSSSPLSAITSIHIQVHPLVLELTNKKTPQDGLSAKFSVYHGAACGLMYGKATPAQYVDSVVLNPSLVALRDKITAIAPTDTSGQASIRPDECRIWIEFGDGRPSLERHVLRAVGSLDRPMTQLELEDKFLDQVASELYTDDADAASYKEKIAAASSLAWSLGQAEDVAVVIKSIVGSV